MKENKRQDFLTKALIRAVEITANSVLVTDKEGTIVYVNDALLETTGYTRSELIGQNPKIFKTETFDKSYYKELWDTIASGKIWSGEFLNQRKDGSTYWEFAIISPVEDRGNVYFVAVKENITRAKQLEQRLICQCAQVEALHDWAVIHLSEPISPTEPEPHQSLQNEHTCQDEKSPDDAPSS